MHRSGGRHIIVGRYVLMPDHIYLFVCGPRDFSLADWVSALKRSISKTIRAERPHWQSGFFDHLLRSGESYEEKWHYVRQNPERAGLVPDAADWLFQGELGHIDRT